MKAWKAIFTWGLLETFNTSSWGTTYMGLRVKRFTGFYAENAERKYSDISMTYSEQISFIFSLWNKLLWTKIRFTNWVWDFGVRLFCSISIVQLTRDSHWTLSYSYPCRKKSIIEDVCYDKSRILRRDITKKVWATKRKRNFTWL